MQAKGAGAILVVGPAWVGDMVMAQSLFIELKRQHPGSAIDVVAPKWSVALLQRMPEVRNAHVLDVGHGVFGLKARYRLGKQLRGQYAWAYILPRSLKAALVPFFAKIPNRIGYLGESRYGLLTNIHKLDTDKLDQTVKRFVNLAHSVDDPSFNIANPKLTVDASRQAELITSLSLDANQPAMALLPGAEFGPSKLWPVEHFQKAAQSLTAQGYQVWLLGSPKDQAIGEQIIGNGMLNVHNLCGKTTLTDAIDLIALCKGAISNDSGLMHVAAAVGIPVVGLYGPTPPRLAPPLSPIGQPLLTNAPCSPCRERACPLGHHECLTKLEPSYVLQSLEQLMQKPTPV